MVQMLLKDKCLIVAEIYTGCLPKKDEGNLSLTGIWMPVLDVCSGLLKYILNQYTTILSF